VKQKCDRFRRTFVLVQCHSITRFAICQEEFSHKSSICRFAQKNSCSALLYFVQFFGKYTEAKIGIRGGFANISFVYKDILSQEQKFVKDYFCTSVRFVGMHKETSVLCTKIFVQFAERGRRRWRKGYFFGGLLCRGGREKSAEKTNFV
jgi:hypothetical protein